MHLELGGLFVNGFQADPIFPHSIVLGLPLLSYTAIVFDKIK